MNTFSISTDCADLRVQAVYQSLLQLTWIDKLLDNIKILFVDLYEDRLKKANSTVLEYSDFHEYFDQQVKELDVSSQQKETAERPSPPYEEGGFEETTPPTFGLKKR